MKRMDLSAAQALAVASQLGFVISAGVLVGVLGGSFLDSRLGTSPWLVVVGAILGTASGMYSAVQMARWLLEQFARGKAKKDQER